MKKVIVILCVVFALIGAADANAHLIAKPKCHSLKCREASQLENLKHARYVCHRGGGKNKQWSCAAVKWLTREFNRTERRLHPRDRGFPIDGCTRTILSREGGMNPHAYNNLTGAYGGPQALPGSKMAAAGADWKDNIWTQIKWMLGYMNGRYGSSCAALAFWNQNSWY